MHNPPLGTVLPPPVEFDPSFQKASAPAAASLNAASRIEGYDVARAIAVLGMMLVNGWQIMLVGHGGPAWFVKFADFLYGRPAVIFVVLAGVGLSLMAKRAIESQDPKKLASVRASLIKRSIILYGMGLIFRHWWSADILHFYGVFLSTGALLLTAPTRRLWGIIFSFLFLSGVIFLVEDKTPPQLEMIIQQTGLLGNLVDDLFISGNYPVVPWFLFLIIGVWLGRHQVIGNPLLRRRLVTIALASLFFSELLCRLVPPILFGKLGLRDEGILSMLFMLNSFPMTPLFEISAVSCAILVLNLALSRPPKLFPDSFWRAMQNTGKLSLSIYILHIFLCIWLESLLRNRISPSLYQGIALSLILLFFFVTPAIADSYGSRFRRGPFEWLLRRAAENLW